MSDVDSNEVSPQVEGSPPISRLRAMRWQVWTVSALIVAAMLVFILVPEATLVAVNAFEAISGVLLAVAAIALMVIGWTFFPTTIVFAVLALPLLMVLDEDGLVFRWLALMLLLAGLGALVRDLEVTTFRWIRGQGLPKRRMRRNGARLAGEPMNDDPPLHELI